MWKLKYGTSESIYKTDSQTQRTDLWLPRGREVEEGTTGRVGLADAIIVYRMDKQQSPAV